MRPLRAIRLAARWTWRIGFATLCLVAAGVLAASLLTRDGSVADHLVHGGAAALLLGIAAWILRGLRMGEAGR